MNNDDVFDTVIQFYFDGLGGGSIVATAVESGSTGLSFGDGVTAIASASVPEPSGIALLALGAAGLVTRRNRKQAA